MAENKWCKWGETTFTTYFSNPTFFGVLTPLIPNAYNWPVAPCNISSPIPKCSHASRMFQNPPVIPDVRIGVWNPLKLERLEVFVGPNIYSPGIWKTTASFAPILW